MVYLGHFHTVFGRVLAVIAGITYARLENAVFISVLLMLSLVYFGQIPKDVSERLLVVYRDTREYILRPEAMETFWYMHQITGDPKYRE